MMDQVMEALPFLVSGCVFGLAGGFSPGPTTTAVVAQALLRRVTGKRPTQHSDKRKWGGFAVQTQAFSPECLCGHGSEAKSR